MGALGISALAQEQAKTRSAPAAPAASRGETHSSELRKADAAVASEERVERLEGEKRFRTNCGRCHQLPHKFPPRVIATAIRHMRVRAMLTEEDTRLILRYMTQ
jgi:mono/diheme cytochrome c family protein